MDSESERIEEITNYIEATIDEIDGHTGKMEELFRMDKTGKDRELYEIIINSYERHRNTLKRIQKMIDGEKVESGLYTLSAKSEIDMIKERIEKPENNLDKKDMEKASESGLTDSEILDGFNEIKSGEAGRMSERKHKESNQQDWSDLPDEAIIPVKYQKIRWGISSSEKNYGRTWK